MSDIKGIYNYSLNDEFSDSLKDLVLNENVVGFTQEGRKSVSAFLENFVTFNFILPDLKRRKINPAKMAALQTSEKICGFWLALRKAERGLAGFKIHTNEKVGILAVQGPNEKGEIVSY